MANVIIKTVERCNINCSYCYFFNKNDKSYQKHPPYITRDIINGIFSFLETGCAELNLKELQIIFHGGEPLMQKKHDFDYMCHQMRKSIKVDDLSFALQTNLLLIDEEWIELLDKYSISVCVSIDGPKEIHDRYRIDKRGEGTFDKTVHKLKFIKQRRENCNISILAVTTPSFPPQEVFDFFYTELQIKQFDFLLPDAHHDDPPSHSVYANFYIAIFEKIVKENINDVRIRFINNILRSFFEEKPICDDKAQGHSVFHPITIASNGELSPVDDLRNTQFGFMNTGWNIKNISYKDFLNTDRFHSLNDAFTHLPPSCLACCWNKICKGGNIIHRYSHQNQFNNPSVYCQALKKIYGKIASHLISEGYPLSELQNILQIH